MAILRCQKCKEDLPSEDFSNSEQRKEHRRRCRPCSRQSKREWAERNPDKVLAYRQRADVREKERARSRKTDPQKRANSYYKYRYGITRDEVDALIEAQGGLCAVCHEPETKIVPKTGKPRRLQIDHDHSTGLPRGMLCQRCNMLLGGADDDVALLERAITYLRQHRAAEGGVPPQDLRAAHMTIVYAIHIPTDTEENQ